MKFVKNKDKVIIKVLRECLHITGPEDLPVESRYLTSKVVDNREPKE